MSTEQVSALKDRRIDLGFGRVRSNDREVERLTLREERLVVAIPRYHPLSASEEPMELAALSEETVILYPWVPRPSFSDEVLSLFTELGIGITRIEEVSDIRRLSAWSPPAQRCVLSLPHLNASGRTTYGIGRSPKKRRPHR